ncbi:unnamed protein product [Nesidiocoris tenuis]|uniref:Uncharacterized protein n=1 Tax=Nesidiocoris tenuis TaxID=355587 RepID=A0A6H5GMW0_9HEMI|nr:unnamed protein product [Nesidiocoris tenuis]CAB0005345.1 unnamed protein product [Nesidiocoris tenuis]
MGGTLGKKLREKMMTFLCQGEMPPQLSYVDYSNYADYQRRSLAAAPQSSPQQRQVTPGTTSWGKARPGTAGVVPTWILQSHKNSKEIANIRNAPTCCLQNIVDRFLTLFIVRRYNLRFTRKYCLKIPCNRHIEERFRKVVAALCLAIVTLWADSVIAVSGLPSLDGITYFGSTG